MAPASHKPPRSGPPPKADRQSENSGFFYRLLDQRVLANLVFVIVVVAGLMGLWHMPVEEFPNVAFDNIEVTTQLPGGSPAEVERSVTQKLEDALKDVKGVQWMKSASVYDLSRIVLKITDDLPVQAFENVYRDIESHVRKAVGELPDTAEPPIVKKLEVETLNPVVSLVVGGPVSEETLRAAAKELEREIETIDGVRQAQVEGYRERELLVEVDNTALSYHKVTLDDVVRTVAGRGVDNPPGRLSGGVGQTQLSVRAPEKWTSVAQLEHAVIVHNRSGGAVRVGDVATVRGGYEPEIVRSRYRGQRAIFVRIIKSSGANALAIRERLDDVLGRLTPRFDEVGLELLLVADTTKRIRNRIGTLAQNLGMGSCLVVVLLTWALGFRMSVIALLGVTFSFLGAFAILFQLGQSVNAISLFGLVLVSGMLVDDAIVVVENIARRFEEGEPLARACVEGVHEVAWPVASAVLTTAAAFVPMLLMSGVTGKFFAVVPIAVVAALTISLFEAIFLLPVHVSELGVGKRKERKSASGRDPRSSLAYRCFDAAVGYSTRWRYATLVLLLAILATSIWGFARAQFVFFPSEYTLLFVNLRMPPGTSLDETTVIVDRADAAVSALPATVQQSTSGTAGFYLDYNYQPHVNTHYGQLLVALADDGVRTVTMREAMSLVRESLDSAGLGNAHIEVLELNDGPPIGRPPAVRVQADDLNELARLASLVEAIVREVPGAQDIQTNLEFGAPEAAVRVDAEWLGYFGLHERDVARVVSTANAGRIASRFEGANEDWDVRVRLRSDQRATLADLERIRLRTPDGRTVEVGEVAEVVEQPGFASVRRFRRRRTVTITGDVDTRISSSLQANAELDERLAPVMAQEPNMRVLYTGEFEETQRSFDSLRSAFLIALLAMYTILGAQFRSYLQPFVILAAVPFAFVGVVGGVYLINDPTTVATLLGMVGLAGVAVNDSIVLVDFANQSRRKGMGAMAAICDAAAKRLRPVVLTSLTTSIGLLPSAIGFGPSGRSVVWGPMAAAFISGLLSATVLTLLATPAVYMIADDLVRLGRRLRKSNPPAPE